MGIITTADLDNSGKPIARKPARRIITTTNTPGPGDPVKDRASVGEETVYVSGKKVRVITTNDPDQTPKSAGGSK